MSEQPHALAPSSATDKLPGQLWIAAGLLAFLRTLPFIVALTVPAPENMVRLPLGNPDKDWFAYASFIEQTGHPSYIFLADPFTTQPQGGRFILLFHSLLGTIHAWTGVNSFWLLELSRIPLIFLLMLALWRFLTPIFPERRERIWCCWLVAFSGGLEFLLVAAAPLLPQWMEATVRSSLHTCAWNTSLAAANSLWIAGLSLMLLCLGPMLRPGIPPAKRERVVLFIAATLLFFVHPYTAVVVYALYVVHLAFQALFQIPVQWPSVLGVGVPLSLAASIFALVSLWQREDAVFKICSVGFMGSQEAAVFWYPLTFGLLAVFVLRGWRQWIAEKHPWRFSLGSWTLTTILLHTSPILNGYHFVYYLHLPVCIVATKSVLSTLQPAFPGAARLTLRTGAIFVTLFASSLVATWQSVQFNLQYGCVPQDFMTAMAALQREKPGNVLASAMLGNFIPACTQHRVYVGQWFLTPDYTVKSAEVKSLMSDLAANAPRLRTLLADQKIRYFCLPTNAIPEAQIVLGSTIERTIVAGVFTVLVLREAGP